LIDGQIAGSALTDGALGLVVLCAPSRRFRAALQPRCLPRIAPASKPHGLTVMAVERDIADVAAH
jgi:hypothetical protein